MSSALRRGLRLVRKARLELARLAAREPKSRASTNSATFAGGNAAAKYISEIRPIGFAKGGWFLVAIDERSTWVEYYSWSDPGAGIPSSMASSLATRGVASTFDAMERFAKEGKPICPVK